MTLLSGETLGPSALVWVTCLLSLLPTLSLLPRNEDSVAPPLETLDSTQMITPMALAVQQCVCTWPVCPSATLCSMGRG